jgi:hypothetical protein
MISSELLPALSPVLAEFDRLGIAYYIGGSVASSLYGQPRSTLDIDLCADVTESVVGDLISKWEHDFYVSESAMRDAIQRGSCFNVIHFGTSLKVDVFVCGNDPFNTSVLKRRQSRTVKFADGDLTIWFASPEDLILHKLAWYRKGGETSERQWRDVAGVLTQQKDRLETTYIADWADRLKVGDLWNRVLGESETSQV